MSSLAAAKADNFYYPPDFDPKKHQTLNKYNGQHPLRERAAKLDQGILVIRFEIPFNIWCDKCGEHIAKGERFNAEKKAIGQYYSTKILQFTMTHHCGCKITIQTDPKRAEYLVIEGARKKDESYSAADAEVIELPDEAERERRERDPLYRLEYQQGAKVKALTAAERLAAIQDVVDARTADPYNLNRAMRAVLRGEKRAAAALDTRRAELGLPESVPLLAPSDGDALAAQVAFLTSSARAAAIANARRKRILEQDIFTSPSSFSAAAPGATGSGAVVDAPAGGRQLGAAHTPSKRLALDTAPLPAAVKVRVAVPQLAAALGDRQITKVESGAEVRTKRYQQDQQQQEAAAQEDQPHLLEEQQGAAQETRGPVAGSYCMAGAAGGAAPNGCRDEAPQRRPSTATGASHTAPGSGNSNNTGCGGTSSNNTGGGSGTGGSAPPVAPTSGRPPPGAAARAVAAARASAMSQASAPRCAAPAHAATGKPSGLGGSAAAAAVPRTGAAHGLGRPPGAVPASGSALPVGSAGLPKRSLKDRAAELQKRRQGLGGVGLALSKPEL